jgi:hypothetical protein
MENINILYDVPLLRKLIRVWFEFHIKLQLVSDR